MRIFCDYAVDFSISTQALLERKHVTVLHALQAHTSCAAEFPEDISTQREMDHVWAGYRVSIPQSICEGDTNWASWDKWIWLQQLQR